MFQVLWADYRTDRYWWGFFDYYRRIALSTHICMVIHMCVLFC